MIETYATVVRRIIPRDKHRWFSALLVRTEDGKMLTLYTAGIAKWIQPREKVFLRIKDKPKKVRDQLILFFDDYELYRIYNGQKILVWPVWSKEVTYPRYSPFGDLLYEYKIRAREAIYEYDFESIAELEQFHYASQKDIVALWKCESCRHIFESNTKIPCPNCGSEDVHILEIKGSTPASRFLILEFLNREEYEPRVLAYVRVDPPTPLMHRRLPDGTIVKNIREKVFPKEWFHPNFWPELLLKKLYRSLKEKYARRVARHKLWRYAALRALAISNTAVSRIARVVVHPDYRSDGLGKLAVKLAVEWIKERRIPEMRKQKHLVETIAQMARYNPFFEKVGFKYVWETASGRPVLYYPLTEEAKKYLEKFFEEDPIAKQHKGRLVVPRYGKVPTMKTPIIFRNVSKIYENELDISRLSKELQDVLIAFGVKHRVIQRQIFRNANLEIKPGEIVVVIGASGSGKTTLLRLIYGAVRGLSEEEFKPTSGEIIIDKEVKVGALIPNEVEPKFGEESILEHICGKTGDVHLAIEILNRIGLSDAVLYRAKFSELSTGQKERAKLASVLAEKPSLLLIDEFAAHLDPLTAMRVARKLAEIAREAGMTVVAVTHRREVIDALAPDKILFVGYGIVKEISYEEFRKARK